MKPWTRLQDFGTLIAGTYAALSPLWISTAGENGAMWTLLVLGVLMAGTALVSLAMPDLVATEWLTVLYGALLFIAPWVFTYTDLDGASWTSWIVGVVAVVLGGSVAATSNRVQQATQQ
jgi:SPW repeat